MGAVELPRDKKKIMKRGTMDHPDSHDELSRIKITVMLEGGHTITGYVHHWFEGQTIVTSWTLPADETGDVPEDADLAGRFSAAHAVAYRLARP